MSEERSALLAIRREKLEKLRDLGVDPFGGPFPGTESSAEIRGLYRDWETNNNQQQQTKNKQ